MNFIRNIVSWLIIIMAVLLPLKLGTLAVLPESSRMYPSSLLNWITFLWPAASFPMFSGVLLLLALMVFPARCQTAKNAFTVAALWLLLALVSILGTVNASNMDYVVTYLGHLWGIASFGAAICLMMSSRPEFKRIMLWGIAIGTMLTLLIGVWQMFWGFDEVRQFLEVQESQRRANLAGDLKAKLLDHRVFATFASSNSLAGYLLLTTPLCVFLSWQFCAGIKRRKYRNIGKMIVVPAFCMLSVMVFVMAASRGAYLSLTLACVVFIMIFPVGKRIRIAIFALAPVVIIAGAFYVAYAGRGFYSMQARFDYIHSSFLIFLKHPWLGTGWGDFLYDHAMLKLTVSNEAARNTHNILTDFLSQAGIAGFTACLAAIIYPIFKLGGKIYNFVPKNIFSSLDSYVFFGLLAFFIHSLMDTNLQIPASMATALAMMVLINIPDTGMINEGKIKQPLFKKINICVFIMMLAAGITASAVGIILVQAGMAFSKLNRLCNPSYKSRQVYFRIPVELVKRELRNCAEVKPYSPFPWAAAANFMLIRGYLDNAEEYYGKARELAPQSSFIYHQLYLLQKKQGRLAEARQNLETARLLFPHNRDYREEPE